MLSSAGSYDIEDSTHRFICGVNILSGESNLPVVGCEA